MQGIDPGGLICDYLRSCYTTKARLFRNDPTQTDIVWYFVPDTRPVLPYSSAFGSRNWDDQVTDWPLGKNNDPAGDGTEVGEVLGAPRPWRNGSDPIHYPGTHALGSADEFANGLKEPPLVYENTCRQDGALGYPKVKSGWLALWNLVHEEGEVPGPNIPCEGLEAVCHAVFRGAQLQGSLRLGLWTGITHLPESEATYADFTQPFFDPAYHPVPVPGPSFTINQFVFNQDCWWGGTHDIVYFHFTGPVNIFGWYISCELTPGSPRILFYSRVPDAPIPVPPTGGSVGITIFYAGYFGRPVSE